MERRPRIDRPAGSDAMNKGGNMDMKKKPEEIVICQVCKKQKKLSEVLSVELVREPILNRITKEYPDWSTSG